MFPENLQQLLSQEPLSPFFSKTITETLNHYPKQNISKRFHWVNSYGTKFAGKGSCFATMEFDCPFICEYQNRSIQINSWVGMR